MEYMRNLLFVAIIAEITVLCLTKEGGIEVSLPLNSFYGPLTIKGHGLQGHICSSGFNDKAARVTCSHLGYANGKAVKSFRMDSPVILGSVECTGREDSLEECSLGDFSGTSGCHDSNTIAAIICYHGDGLEFSLLKPVSMTENMQTRVEIKVDDTVMYVSYDTFTDTDAAVYCRSVGYAGGKTLFRNTGPYKTFHVSDVTCTGSETNILRCPAFWDPGKVNGYHTYHAEVNCRPEIYLEGAGNSHYGIVIVTNKDGTGLVSAEGFDLTDAEVICRNLGFEKGLSTCCDPFGALTEPPLITNVNCSGSEVKLSDCSNKHAKTDDKQDVYRNYASVACYSGRLGSEYSFSILEYQSNFVGPLLLTFMGIVGGICPDLWDERDARVLCQELGFKNGKSYIAVKAHTSFDGPFWTSNVSCLGTENILEECNKTSFGEVTECSDSSKLAAVVCYDNDGMHYRISGTEESRQGRVEMSINDVWRSLCIDYWTDVESHVLCRMLGYSTGDSVVRSKSGPQWDVDFECDWNSVSLNECLQVVDTCARRHEEVGVFCYRSVKLSSGVGRQNSDGIVLFYMEGTWYSVCADNFTSVSARVVCKELGYVDGAVKHLTDRSRYAFPLLRSHKIMCNGTEEDVSECLVKGDCPSQDFASVVCYNRSLEIRAAEQVKHSSPVPVIAITVSVVLTTVVLLFIILGITFIGKRTRRNAYRSIVKYSLRKNLDDGDVLLGSSSNI